MKRKLSRVEQAYREFRSSLGDLTQPEIVCGALRYDRPLKDTAHAINQRKVRASYARGCERKASQGGCLGLRQRHKWVKGVCAWCGKPHLTPQQLYRLKRGEAA